MIIKLVPHVGYQHVPGRGVVEVSLKQDMIFIDGIHCGYVGHHKNAGVAIITTVSEAEIHRIRDAVDKVRGEFCPKRCVALPAPKVGENAEEETPLVQE